MDDSAYRTIKGLRAVRHYQPRPLAPEDLAAILEAGRWTGSSKNVQGWVFVVCEEVADREALATAGDYTDPIRNAAAAVALVKTAAGNDFDIGRAAQNLMLAATTRGVASCPVTLHHTDTARSVLGLGPDEECRYAIALGYPDREADAAARANRRRSGLGGRRPAETVIRRRGDRTR
jgi:nitroreductase